MREPTGQRIDRTRPRQACEHARRGRQQQEWRNQEHDDESLEGRGGQGNRRSQIAHRPHGDHQQCDECVQREPSFALGRDDDVMGDAGRDDEQHFSDVPAERQQRGHVANVIRPSFAALWSAVKSLNVRSRYARANAAKAWSATSDLPR